MDRRDCARALRSMAIGAFVSTWMAAPADAGEYSCRVPRALLCKGCASQIAIVLQPGGGCRISFSPQGLLAPDSGQDQLDFRVSAPPNNLLRVPQRARLSRPSHRATFAGQAPPERCFVFNAQKYCE
jgi:hypothetical protein